MNFKNNEASRYRSFATSDSTTRFITRELIYFPYFGYTKLQKTVTSNGNVNTTTYAGNFIYEDGALQLLFQPEGYVQPDGNGGFEYVYQYKDHLGNVRLSYSDSNNNEKIDPDTEILDEKNYYPFGLQHKGYNNTVTGSEHPYKFNGKELNEELGLGWYDYGARNYDASLGRWFKVDPLAEKFPWQSPYVFTNNNPINFIDPDGRAAISAQQPEDWIKYLKTGEVKWFDATGKEAINMAAAYWENDYNPSKGVKNPGNYKNLGDSFFGTTKGSLEDKVKITSHQISYLREVSSKINKKLGVRKFLGRNTITYEYLSNKFLGTSSPFGKRAKRGSDLPGLIWDYGISPAIDISLKNASDFTKVSTGLLTQTIGLFFSSQPLGRGSTINYRARNVHKFKTRGPEIINVKTLIDISLHKF